MVKAHNEALEAVNARLKKGEGWIGYRYSKDAKGERVGSRYLYISFYVGDGANKKQKFVLTDTNDAEEAYRQLLEARNSIFEEGNHVLPQEVRKLPCEDLRAILIDHYREHHPDSITGINEEGLSKICRFNLAR